MLLVVSKMPLVKVIRMLQIRINAAPPPHIHAAGIDGFAGFSVKPGVDRRGSLLGLDVAAPGCVPTNVSA